MGNCTASAFDEGDASKHINRRKLRDELDLSSYAVGQRIVLEKELCRNAQGAHSNCAKVPFRVMGPNRNHKEKYIKPYCLFCSDMNDGFQTGISKMNHHGFMAAGI